MTRVSVLMPTYRGARYVDAALESLTEQPGVDVEVIVTDDGSDDGTMERVERFRDRLELRVLDGARRGNWVASTNVALRAATGTFCCMLHQDDGMRPGRLATLVAALDRHDGARWALHSVDVVDEVGASLVTWHPPFGRRERVVPSHELVAKLLVQNSVAVPAPLFRTEDARAFGGLDEALWYAADWDLWLRLAARGPAVYVPQRLAFYRIHGAAQTITRSGDGADVRGQLETVLARHERGCRPLPPASVHEAARVSIELNLVLAQVAHGGRADWDRFVASLKGCSGDGLRRLARDSRIHERLSARILARLRNRLATR